MKNFNLNLIGIKERGPYTTLDVLVNLREGVVARTCCEIVQECRDYPEEIYFVKKEDMHFKVRGDSIIGLLMLGVAPNTELTMYVKGHDKEAKKLIMRLHSALTSWNSYDMDFDKYKDFIEDVIQTGKYYVKHG